MPINSAITAWQRLPGTLRHAVLLYLIGTTALTAFDCVAVVVGQIPASTEYPWYEFVPFTFLRYSASIAPIVIAVVAADALTPARGVVRWLVMASALLVSTFAGQWVAFHMGDADPAVVAGSQAYWRGFLSMWLMFCFPALLLLGIHEFHRLGVQAMDDAFRARASRIALESELSRAQFQTLRAQVEPHFLFNTLANLRRLYGLDSQAGRELLHSLRTYLQAALPQLRDQQPRLREEAVLIRAYLDIFRVRMGARLSYEVDFPVELLNVRVPPMMLLTLVENAIKHGLAPLPEGGYLRVSARARNRSLELHVADSGRGMGAGSGQGSGLANIRARLAAAYGAEAALALSLNRPRGVTATLRLPLPSPT